MESNIGQNMPDVNEKMMFDSQDCDAMITILYNVKNELSNFTVDHERSHIQNVANAIQDLSNIFFHYTPYLDLLAKNLEELGTLILHQEDFIEIFEQKTKKTLMLFDAICTDLELYVERFSIESLAMENIHQIHEPTSLSIRQIIGFIRPEDVDDGGMEFF